MTSRPQAWRMLRRLRHAGRCLQAPALGFLLREPFGGARRRRIRQARHLRADTVRTALYRLWIRRYEPTAPGPRRSSRSADSPIGDHRGLAAGNAPLKFALLVTGGENDPEGLDRTVDSLRNQSLDGWGLHALADAGMGRATLPSPLPEGEILLYLDAGDRLAPDALREIADRFGRLPEIELAYGDEDHLSSSGDRFAPHFKPDWNPELFWSTGYLGAAVAIRRSRVEPATGPRVSDGPLSRAELVACCVADLPAERIAHIPGILLHRAPPRTGNPGGATPEPPEGEACTAPLAESLLSLPGRRVQAEAGRLPGTLRITWPLPASPPRASLVVLTRNGLNLLNQCLASVRAKTLYPDYEIVVVDHGSDDPATLARLDELRGEEDVKVVRREGPFNFSALNNDAVAATRGEILVFLNNDVEILTHGWLREMVSQALRPEVGAVGARLLYPDGRLQHGGVLLGGGAPTDAVAGHFSHGIRADDPGYFGRAWATQALSAVTAACLVLRRNVFERVGGFDAAGLPVAFNDVDLCLRIRQEGLRVVWTPWAEALHHESATRGDDLAGPARERFVREARLMRDRWGAILDRDPCYNPNLDPVECDFALAFPPGRNP